MKAGRQDQGGVTALADAVRQHAREVQPGRRGEIKFILWISELYAFIRLQDMRQPLRFLKQMAGTPPVQFGTKGFRQDLVDDDAPSRHYIAFVFVGFWLTYTPALIALWLWELLGFVRYGGKWSQNDVRMGLIGVRHGTLVRRRGPHVLADLILRDLAAS